MPPYWRPRGYRYGTHNFPTDVRATVLGMHRTRVETLMDLGITPRILTDHKVMDGINAKLASCSRRMWFGLHEGCSDGPERPQPRVQLSIGRSLTRSKDLQGQPASSDGLDQPRGLDAFRALAGH